MQYMQQKTPFIERWEKAMEEMLNKETEGQRSSPHPPSSQGHHLPTHPGVQNSQHPSHSMSQSQLQPYGSDNSSPSRPLPTEFEGQLPNDPLKSQQLSRQADMQRLTSYAEEIVLGSKEKEREKEREKISGLEDNEDKVRDEGEKSGKQKKRKKDGEDEEESRKEIHNATEKKRREKINTKLEELKSLIPHCKNTNAQKAAVLAQAVDYIKTLVSSYNEQVELNRKLQENTNVLNNELKELHQSLWQRDRVFLSNLQQYRGF